MKKSYTPEMTVECYSRSGQILICNNNHLEWTNPIEYEIERTKKERKQKLEKINEKANSTN